MKNFWCWILLSVLLGFGGSACEALPRDAVAVLNRCGKPLHGDETILENSVAGGRRTLSYERGTLNFNKMGLEGWTFVSGSHGGSDNLNAAQMGQFMPCLVDGLDDSASLLPIKQISSLTRVEISAKRSIKTLVVDTLILLAVLGVLLFILSRRSGFDREIA